MQILIDIGGADKGITVPLSVVCKLVEKVNVELILVGIKKDIINGLVKIHKQKYINKFKILECKEYITNNEEPSSAIKYKKESNLVVAFEYLKNNENTAFISASSTGALMAGGLLKVGRIKGIKRPALLTILPTINNSKVVFLDSGAHPLAKTETIIQYAKLGKIYSKNILKVENPKIALLNIGAEEKKGTDTLKEVHSILKETEDNFIGNIESRYILKGDSDVIVCDGLMGNVALKSFEGATSTMLNILSKEFKKNIGNKLLGLMIKPILKKSLEKYDYTKMGGAILIGIKKPIIKVHGNSKESSYESAIYQTIEILEQNIVEKIESEQNGE